MVRERIYQLPAEDGTDFIRPEKEMTYDDFVETSGRAE